MRILMISDVYFPRVNGVSTSIMTFMQSLLNDGHEVKLIAPSYDDSHGEESGIIRIPSRHLPFDPEDRMLKMRHILRKTAELREWAPDILHIQTPFVAHYAGMKLARRLGIPVIETYHTYFEEYLFHYIPFLPKQLMRYLARSFSRRQCNALDGLIVPSKAMEALLRDYGIRTSMAIIPTGLNIDMFRRGDRTAFCQRHRIDPKRPILMHIGRIAHEKNIAFLLKVVDEITETEPAVLFVIAGEGPAKPMLEKLVAEMVLQDNVMFIGYLQRGQELWNCYSAADTFIFASRTETQGLVLLEAMALGVPVVSTAIMGTKDILTAGKGAIVAQEDVDDFADKVCQLLRNEGFRIQIGGEGREYASTWSTERMTEKLLGYYGSRLERPRLHATRDEQVRTV